MTGRVRFRSAISSVIHTWIRQSRGHGQNLSVGVPITDVPVYIPRHNGIFSLEKSVFC